MEPNNLDIRHFDNAVLKLYNQLYKAVKEKIGKLCSAIWENC